MRKTVRKMSLNRDTVRRLDTSALAKANGARFCTWDISSCNTNTANSCEYTQCCVFLPTTACG